MGERIVLVVETSSPSEVRSDIEKRLHQAELEIDQIVFVNDPLPVDPRHNAKIDYQKLRTCILSDQGASRGEE